MSPRSTDFTPTNVINKCNQLVTNISDLLDDNPVANFNQSDDDTKPSQKTNCSPIQYPKSYDSKPLQSNTNFHQNNTLSKKQLNHTSSSSNTQPSLVLRFKLNDLPIEDQKRIKKVALKHSINEDGKHSSPSKSYDHNISIPRKRPRLPDHDHKDCNPNFQQKRYKIENTCNQKLEQSNQTPKQIQPKNNVGIKLRSKPILEKNIPKQIPSLGLRSKPIIMTGLRSKPIPRKDQLSQQVSKQTSSTTISPGLCATPNPMIQGHISKPLTHKKFPSLGLRSKPIPISLNKDTTKNQTNLRQDSIEKDDHKRTNDNNLHDNDDDFKYFPLRLKPRRCFNKIYNQDGINGLVDEQKRIEKLFNNEWKKCDELFQQKLYQQFEMNARKTLDLGFDWLVSLETNIRVRAYEIRKMTAQNRRECMKDALDGYDVIINEFIPSKILQLESKELNATTKHFERAKAKAKLRLFTMEHVWEYDQLKENYELAEITLPKMFKLNVDNGNDKINISVKDMKHVVRMAEEYVNLVEWLNDTMGDGDKYFRDFGKEWNVQ